MQTKESNYALSIIVRLWIYTFSIVVKAGASEDFKHYIEVSIYFLERGGNLPLDVRSK